MPTAASLSILVGGGCLLCLALLIDISPFFWHGLGPDASNH
jgi:hypothetical protein